MSCQAPEEEEEEEKLRLLLRPPSAVERSISLAAGRPLRPPRPRQPQSLERAPYPPFFQQPFNSFVKQDGTVRKRFLAPFFFLSDMGNPQSPTQPKNRTDATVATKKGEKDIRSSVLFFLSLLPGKHFLPLPLPSPSSNRQCFLFPFLHKNERQQLERGGERRVDTGFPLSVSSFRPRLLKVKTHDGATAKKRGFGGRARKSGLNQVARIPTFPFSPPLKNRKKTVAERGGGEERGGHTSPKPTNLRTYAVARRRRITLYIGGGGAGGEGGGGRRGEKPNFLLFSPRAESAISRT